MKSPPPWPTGAAHVLLGPQTTQLTLNAQNRYSGRIYYTHILVTSAHVNKEPEEHKPNAVLGKATNI